MLKFHSLLVEKSDELAALIVRENGKNIAEARAEVAKGLETVEYACSLPQVCQGKILQVSSAVRCEDRREPLGVVACVVPFNFPMMVPMWTVPIALTMGNCVVLKPSEKVPMTMSRVAEILAASGLPPGVFGMIHGGKDAAAALIEHPDVTGVTFVGSSPVARAVYELCQRSVRGAKRCLALGGAKNHLVALGDAPVSDTAKDVVVSFAGCAGQRCMAASVLLIVGENESLVEEICKVAAGVSPGEAKGCMGPVIDGASYEKILKYVNGAEERGAKVLLDGRTWKGKEGCTPGGHWIGPTVILFTDKNDPTIKEEIFGPVLSVYKCKNREEAIAIENDNPFGNAACVYTNHGGQAEWFCKRFRAAMLGVNIGIPVPREPFSFGGLYGTQSKYGRGDITGEGAIEFFSDRVKVTSKWFMGDTASANENGSGGDNAQTVNMDIDKASFVGNM